MRGGEGPGLCCNYVLRSLTLSPQELQHVGQRVQIPSMLDVFRDDGDVGCPIDSSPEPVGQHVVNGPFPAAHAGADGFLLDVLAECGTFLGELG